MADLAPHNDPLSKGQVFQLIRRTHFTYSKPLIDSLVGQTAANLVSQMTQEITELPEMPIDPATGVTWLNPRETDANSQGTVLEASFVSWQMERMRTLSMDLTERMVFFHHTHFTTRSEKVGVTPRVYQNQLFRYYAFGNFRELTKKICVDNAMVEFLDGYLNDRRRQNENFAREFLELYSIGKGPQVGADNYTFFTEADVQLAAKVFSGVKVDDLFTNIDPDTELPTGFVKTNSDIRPQNPQSSALEHDESEKRFTGSLGAGGSTIAPQTIVNGRATIESYYQELSDFVDMVFEREETAKHICRKLYRFFVYYQITDEIEQDIIVPLAETLRTNDYELLPVLEQLLTSRHFFDLDNAVTDDDHRAAIIKSPLEIMMGTFGFFELDFSYAQATNQRFIVDLYLDNLIPNLRDMGIDFNNPEEVAGYPAYHQYPEYNRHWITANNLGQRYLFIDNLMNGYMKDMDVLLKLDVVDFIENKGYITDPTDADELVILFVEYLLPNIISEERYTYFRDSVLLDNLSIINWRIEWENYQSSGDDSAVRIQLEALVREIIQSPEYQLL